MLAALLAWLWPIGIGGKMPVGGDVTQFFMGLMGFLGESLRAGGCRSGTTCGATVFPAWRRARWGCSIRLTWFSTAGLSTETAYVVSLVLHTLWGGLGAFWAARRLGISRGVGPGGVCVVDVRVLS